MNIDLESLVRITSKPALTHRLPAPLRWLLWAAEKASNWQRDTCNVRGGLAASPAEERFAWREADQLAELVEHLQDVRSGRVGRKWAATNRIIFF